MRIIYLDEPSYLPEAEIARLKGLGDFEAFYDRPDIGTAVERLDGADIAIVEWTKIDGTALRSLSRLKHIVLVLTGYEMVDIAAARECGITVSNTPEYSRQSVAEHIFGMFHALSKRVKEADEVGRRAGASYMDHSPGIELCGKTVGIVGFGSIGSWVAKLALGYDMRVVAHSRSRIRMPEVEQMELERLLEASNFVALCLPARSAPGLIGSRELDLLPRDAVLVNVAGNSLLDEDALADRLVTGHLFGAAVEETDNDALRQAPNALITGGTAWYTSASLDRNIRMVVDTVSSCVDGSPRFVVN